MAKSVTKYWTKKLEQPAKKVANFWHQPVFRDKLFITFSLANVIISVLIVGLLLFNVRPKDFVVPIQYSTLQGFDALGAWYRVYAFGIFSLLVTFGNSYLASISYRRSRIMSFFLVFGAAVVNVITFMVVITLISNLDL